MTAAALDNARSADKQSGCGFAGEVDAHVTKGEQRVLELIKRCDFTGQGCYPTQDELAFMSGYKRPYVNACVKSLERKGLMRIEKRRRPGCKWSHNVYFVRDWGPNVRRGICELRRNFQDSRTRGSSRGSRSSFQCSDTERTAKPSRAQTPVVNPFLTAAVENKRCGRERENGLSRLSRRTWMQEARFHRQRHLTVPDLTCPKCQELAQELEAKGDIVRTLQLELNRLMSDLAGQTEAARATGKANEALRAKLTKQHNESVLAEKIEQVIAHWRTHRPKTTRAFEKPTSKAYGIIKSALVLMEDDDAGPVSACCEAIDGLHLAPYQEYDRWYATDGPNRTLRNGVEYALGDEARIERCRAMARRARNASLEAKLRAYRTSGEVHEAWTRALLDELHGQKPDDVVEVDGIVVRP